MEQLKKQNSLLLQLVQGLQSQINSKNKENQILFQQYEQTTIDNDLLRQQVDQLRNRLKELQKPSKKKIQSDRDSNSPTEVELDEVKRELQKDQDTIKMLRIEVEEKGGVIVFLESQLNDLKEVLDRQPEAPRIPEPKQSTIEFQNKIRDLEGALEIRSNTVNELTQYMNQQAKKISELTSESMATITNYETKLEQKDRDIEQLKKRIDELTKEDEIRLNEDVKELQVLEEVKKTEKMDISDSQKWKALEIQIEQLKEMIASKDQSLSELGQYLTTFTSKEEDIEIEHLKQVITSKDLSLNELGQFLTTLTSKATQNEEIINQLRQEMVGKETQWSKERDELMARRTEVQGESKPMKEDKQESKEEGVFESADEIDQTEVKLSAIEGEVSKLKEIISEKQKVINDYSGKIAELTEKVEKYEGQIDDLEKSLFNNEKNLSEMTQFMNEQMDAKNDLSEKVRQYEDKEAGELEGAKTQNRKWKEIDEKLVDLEEIIAAKDSTIMELSEFMNEQAMRLAELETREEGGMRQSQMGRSEQLEQIIASKEESLGQMRQFLQQSYQRISQLQEKLASLQQKFESAKAIHIPNQNSNKPRESDFNDELQTEAREMVTELSEMIGEKTSLLQKLGQEIIDQENRLQKISEEYKQLMDRKEQLEIQGELRMGEREQSDLDREDNMNGMVEVLQTLQTELRTKEEIIESLEQQLISSKGKQTVVKQNLTESLQILGQQVQKDRKICELQAQVQDLKTQHYELTRRLDRQAEYLTIQQKQEVLSLEQNMRQESKKLSKAYKQQLQSLKGESKGPQSLRASSHFLSMDNSRGFEREEGITTAELLSQLMVYSDDETNEKAIKVLVTALSKKYQSELAQFQNHSGQLKETVQSLKEENEHLQVTVQRVTQEIKEKDEIIGELQEINDEAARSFHSKIEEIRQSISVFGGDISSSVLKVIDDRVRETRGRSGSFDKSAFRHSLNVDSKFERGLPKIKESMKGRSEVDAIGEVQELRQEVQRLREQGERKEKELMQLRSNNNQSYALQLENILEDNAVVKQSASAEQLKIQQLQNQKQKLLQKCQQLQNLLQSSVKQCQQQDQLIQELTLKLKERQIGSETQLLPKSQLSRINDTASKILQEMQGKPPRQSQGASYRRNQEVPETPSSDYQIERGVQRQIIMELQVTILNMEKGFNNEIMELRRNIAQLQAELINVRRHLYNADPDAINVADLIRDTCSQTSKQKYYKVNYKPRYTNGVAMQDNRSAKNMSYCTEGRRASRYNSYFDQSRLNLGQKMMGRPVRGNYPVNFTINNEFKLNNSGWDMSMQHPN